MQMQDDREGNTFTYPIVIGGVDNFLSGWGKASNVLSYAGWACKEEDKDKVLEWIKNRGDIRKVKERDKDWRPAGNGHCHIYVVREGHPALA